MRSFFAILLSCVLVAVAYGIVHDQITARVCIEYFTVGHRDMIGRDDPTLHGLYWGVAATWWCGAMLGFGLACTSRLGSRPKHTLRTLRKPIIVLVVAMGLMALLSGLAGGMLANSGQIVLPDWIKTRLVPAKWAAFQSCAFAHEASYSVAFVGGGMVIVWAWFSRRRLQTRAAFKFL